MVWYLEGRKFTVGKNNKCQYRIKYQTNTFFLVNKTKELMVEFSESQFLFLGAGSLSRGPVLSNKNSYPEKKVLGLFPRILFFCGIPLSLFTHFKTSYPKWNAFRSFFSCYNFHIPCTQMQTLLILLNVSFRWQSMPKLFSFLEEERMTILFFLSYVRRMGKSPESRVEKIREFAAKCTIHSMRAEIDGLFVLGHSIFLWLNPICCSGHTRHLSTKPCDESGTTG